MRKRKHINTILTNVRRKSVDGKWGKHSNCIYSKRKYWLYRKCGVFFCVPLFCCEGWRMRNEILIIRMRYIFLQGKFIGWHKVLWYSIISRNVNEILSLGEVFFFCDEKKKYLFAFIRIFFFKFFFI